MNRVFDFYRGAVVKEPTMRFLARGLDIDNLYRISDLLYGWASIMDEHGSASREAEGRLRSILTNLEEMGVSKTSYLFRFLSQISEDYEEGATEGYHGSRFVLSIYRACDALNEKVRASEASERVKVLGLATSLSQSLVALYELKDDDEALLELFDWNTVKGFPARYWANEATHPDKEKFYKALVRYLTDVATSSQLAIWNIFLRGKEQEEVATQPGVRQPPLRAGQMSGRTTNGDRNGSWFTQLTNTTLNEMNVRFHAEAPPNPE